MLSELRVFESQAIGRITQLIPFLNHSEIRREAADSAKARQGEATTYRDDLEMELVEVANGSLVPGLNVIGSALTPALSQRAREQFAAKTPLLHILLQGRVE